MVRRDKDRVARMQRNNLAFNLKVQSFNGSFCPFTECIPLFTGLLIAFIPFNLDLEITSVVMVLNPLKVAVFV
jgi:hypothetical protein